MHKALVETATGKVVNVIEWNPSSNWQLPAGYKLQDGPCNPGDTWDGARYITPPETTEQLTAKTLQSRRLAARDRAIQAIKDNAGAAPWGAVLKDMAIAQGLMDPD